MEKSKNLKNIYKLVQKTIQDHINQKLQVDYKIGLQATNGKNNSDFQCPSLVKIFNDAKKDGVAFECKSAKELTQKIVQEYKPLPNFLENLNENNNGQLFIKLKEQFIQDEINQILQTGSLQYEKEKLKIVVDFSSPNVAKEMHVGHLRSTIIGDAMCRILEFMGHEVLRHNHVGDWGTQFGMLIQYTSEEFPDYQKQMPDIKDLETFYKSAKKRFVLFYYRFDSDPIFKKNSQENVVKLQAGDPVCREAWKVICEVSRTYFSKLYQRLDIKLEEKGESFYNPNIESTIKECDELGLVKLDNGAKCIFLEGYKIPLIVQKSDGGFNYDSTDLTAIKYRIQELKCNWLIYVTDMGQGDHFNMIFKAANMAGWTSDKIRIDHMPFGLVQGSDGKKFKTRSGDNVKLMDLLDEGKERALKDLKSRMGKTEEGEKTNLNEQELEQFAERIGIAAIKYYDLRMARTSDYRFDYDKMLANQGNTAVYCIYSYVRVCSILRKANLTEEKLQELIQKGFKITHPHEVILAHSVLKLAENLDFCLDDLTLHRLTDLLYDIAGKLAVAYKQYRIIDDPNFESRILLIYIVKLTFCKIFNLLGIDPVEKI